jgi:FkbM family methyltransferase
MPSQNNEDQIIHEYVSRSQPATRRFLEIGAFDPIALSNTRNLVESGWAGVYVEPAPDNAARFLREYKSNNDIILVNAAIGLESKLIKFFDSGGDAVSSSSTAHVAKWTAGSNVRFTPFLVKTITLSELFDAVGNNFSFINLDVENLNIELFRAFPFEELIAAGLELFCVEHDGHYEEMRAKMGSLGFKELLFNGENLIFGLDR